MHIKVSDILAQGEGYRTSFEVAEEAIELDEFPMAQKLNGQLTLTRTEDGVLVYGDLTTAVMLSCHRCLDEFAFNENLHLQGEFTRQPQEDQWPIAKDFSIDLSPLIEEEIVLGIPIKQLCRLDCPGLDPSTGEINSKKD